MSRIFQLSSFTLSILAVYLAFFNEPVRADADDEYYRQVRELRRNGKYSKEAANKIYQNTVLKQNALNVNLITKENEENNKKWEAFKEKPPVEDKNPPGSKTNPIDKKTGLTKDGKGISSQSDKKVTATNTKAKKTTTPVQNIEPTTETKNQTKSDIKVDASNLPDEMSFPGKEEVK